MAIGSKSGLRDRLLVARRSLSDADRARQAAALAEHLDRSMADGGTVCAYVPIGAEPGSIEMVDVLARHADRVLLPVTRTDADDDAVALQWGHYRAGELVPARFGLREPAGPYLPAAAIGEASVVIVPALAVDRRGTRLGRGRGFYDRTLVLRGPGVRLIAVVRDEELLDEVPREPHDVAMTHALTPGRGLVRLDA